MTGFHFIFLPLCGSGSSFHTHLRAIPSFLNSPMISIALCQNYFIINCPELVIQIDYILYIFMNIYIKYFFWICNQDYMCIVYIFNFLV